MAPPPLAALLAAAILALTVALMALSGPRGRGPAALLGAGLAVAAGLASPRDLAAPAGGLAGALATVLASGFMAAVLDGAGAFRWAAFNLAARAGGSGRRLFWHGLLLGVAMTLFCNNEGSVAFATPIALEVARWAGLPRPQAVALAAATGLAAVAAGALTGTGSLPALVGRGLWGMGAWAYLRLALVPALAGLAAATAVLAALVLPALPGRYRLQRPMAVLALGGARRRPARRPAVVPLVTDPWLVRAGLAAVALGQAAYFALDALGLPPAWGPVAAAVLLASGAAGRGGGHLRRAAAAVPWQAVGATCGLYLVAAALHQSGATRWLQALAGFGADPRSLAVAAAVAVALVGAAGGNLAAILLAHQVLRDLPLPAGALSLVRVGALLGSELGALATPLGTVPGLIWLTLMRQRGCPAPWAAWCRLALPCGAVALAAALAALLAWHGPSAP